MLSSHKAGDILLCNIAGLNRDSDTESQLSPCPCPFSYGLLLGPMLCHLSRNPLLRRFTSELGVFLPALGSPQLELI